MAPIGCSVLIASHGEALYLRRVLNALAIQTYTDFDVVLIDNNSRAHLSEKIADLFGGRMRIIHEPQVGLSRARNLAMTHAKGKYVAFLDDDAVPDPSWLAALLAGLCQYGVSVVGGSIRLGFQAKMPDWLGIEHRLLLAELLYNGHDIPSIGASQYICGGNMATYASTFERVGGFAESFGRVGSLLRSSEELEWCRRVQAVGSSVAFIYSAQVEHLIGPSRLKLSYFYRRGYWQGRSDALLESRHGRPAEFGLRSNRQNVAELIRRFAALLCSRNIRISVSNSTALARELGYSIQYAKLHVASRRTANTDSKE